MAFDGRDWALVGLILVFNVLMRLNHWMLFVSNMRYDPFGTIMECIGGIIGAIVLVYVLKRAYEWYRGLPDA